MISTGDIEKLAALSRIELTSDEVENMKKDMASILAYVDELKKVSITEEATPHLVSKNTLREDVVSHNPEMYTEDLVALSPKREGRFVAVKKIL